MVNRTPVTAGAASSPRIRCLSWLLFATLLVSYAFFVHRARVGDWNQLSRLALARAIVVDRSVRIDSFHETTGDKARFAGHYYTDKAIGSSLFAVPTVFILAGLFHHYDEQWSLYAVIVTCLAVPSALAGVLLFRSLVLLRPDSGAGSNLFLTLAYSLGTIAFPFSTLYYGEQIAAWTLIVSFYLLLVGTQGGRPSALLFSGFFVGLSAITEYPGLLVALIFGIYALAQLRQRVRFAWFLGGALPPLAGHALYNHLLFGSPFTLSYQYAETYGFVFKKGLIGLLPPTWDAFYGLTIGPYRGLLYLSPFLLLALPGVYSLWKARNRAITVLCLSSFAVFFGINLCLERWWGMANIGPRYLIPGIPFLIVLASGAYDRWRRLFWSLAAVGFFFMFIATAVDPRAPDDLTQTIFSFYLPLFTRQLTSPTILSPVGLNGFAALAPLVLFIAAMAWLMARAANVQPKMPRSSHLAWSIAPAVALLLFDLAASRQNAEVCHRQRGDAFFWAIMSRGFKAFPEAEAEYRRVIELNPADTRSHTQLGQVYIKWARAARASADSALADRLVDQAEREFAIAAAALGPDDEQVLIGRSDVAIARGQYDRAEAYLQQAVSLYPDSPVPKRLLQLFQAWKQAHQRLPASR